MLREDPMKDVGSSSAVAFGVVLLGLARLCFAPNVLAQQPASSVSATSPTLQTGTLIDSSNMASFVQLLPPGADIAVQHGLKMRVVTNKRLDWSAGFTEETEKYSGQVGLDSDDYLTNYVAGMPFPTVGTIDPKAAVKIAYNWHMGPFMPDDFSQEPWGSFAYTSTDAQDAFIEDEPNDYLCRKMIFLRYAHRTAVEPRPTLDSNEDGLEWKLRCLEWKSGPDMSPGFNTGYVARYLDPRKPDREVFGNKSRRYGGDPPFPGLPFPWYPDERCRSCHQPLWAYALPKTEDYSYRLLGTTTVLACLTTDHARAGIAARDNVLVFGEEPFQLRNAYILEMTPKVQKYDNRRIVIYIDSEAYVWLGAKFFDGDNQTEAAFPIWRSRPTASGGYIFELAGSVYIPFDKLVEHHFIASNGKPRLFFRSLAPAHGEFSQQINTGKVSEDDFDREKTP
jgi:uncharacterized protein DUF1329